MNYLWDTHALIFAMDGDPELPEKSKTIARQGDNAISCISLWEVSALAFKGKIKLKMPVADWLEEAAERLPIIPVTPMIAARAYDLEDFHGDPADRIIAATSLVYPSIIVTRDGKLNGHKKLRCVWD
jgi:PIN domain nuclease of toxin-antitoxin system